MGDFKDKVNSTLSKAGLMPKQNPPTPKEWSQIATETTRQPFRASTTVASAAKSPAKDSLNLQTKADTPISQQKSKEIIKPLKSGGEFTNSAFDKSKLPEGKTDKNGSLTSDKPAALPSNTFGEVKIPKGSQFNPDGSIKVGADTRVRIDNFPIDVPKGSTFDKDGNLKLTDGMTIAKGGIVKDSKGTTLKPSDFVIKDGKIIDLSKIPESQRASRKEEILSNGFQYKDEKGNRLPQPKLAPEQNRAARNYAAPYADPEANKQYNGYQNSLAPERANEAKKYLESNPTEAFNVKDYNGDKAKALVAAAKDTTADEGMCYEAVWGALKKAKAEISTDDAVPPKHAYQFAEYLNTKKTEITSDKGYKGLKSVTVPSNANAIPAGAICVWNRGSGGYSSESGHISVADGQGSQYYGRGADGFRAVPDHIFITT